MSLKLKYSKEVENAKKKLKPVLALACSIITLIQADSLPNI